MGWKEVRWSDRREGKEREGAPELLVQHRTRLALRLDEHGRIAG